MTDRVTPRPPWPVTTTSGSCVICHRGGAGLQTGIEFAVSRGAEVIVTFDADGQHSAPDLPALVTPIRRGECEVVLGSRFLGHATGIPFVRRCLLQFAVWGTRITTRLRVTHTHNNLRALSANAMQRLVLSEDGMAHASELLSKLATSKLPWREIPVTIQYTQKTLNKGQINSAAFQIAFRMLTATVVE